MFTLAQNDTPPLPITHLGDENPPNGCPGNTGGQRWLATAHGPLTTYATTEQLWAAEKSPIAHECYHWATPGHWAIEGKKNRMNVHATAHSPLPIAQKMQAWWYGAKGKGQRFLLPIAININIANMSALHCLD